MTQLAAAQRQTRLATLGSTHKCDLFSRNSTRTAGPFWAADSKARCAHIRAIRRMGPRHGDRWLEVR
jgi:hypothetical protein